MSLSNLSEFECQNEDCHRVHCGTIEYLKSCKHKRTGWAMRNDGGHVIEISTLNELGDKLFLVCADCHEKPENILGLSTASPRLRTGHAVFNLDNPEHVSRLIPHLKTMVTPLGKKVVLLNRAHGHIDVTGMKSRTPETRRINIVRERQKMNKRISIARSLLYVLEEGTMHVSGEDRKAIYDIVHSEREKDLERKRKNKEKMQSYFNECIDSDKE